MNRRSSLVHRRAREAIDTSRDASTGARAIVRARSSIVARVEAFTVARARPNRDARELFPSGATTTRCPTDRDVVTVPYCASSNTIYVEFEWARACAFLHSSIHGVFEYEVMFHTRDMCMTIY